MRQLLKSGDMGPYLRGFFVSEAMQILCPNLAQMSVIKTSISMSSSGWTA